MASCLQSMLCEVQEVVGQRAHIMESLSAYRTWASMPPRARSSSSSRTMCGLCVGHDSLAAMAPRLVGLPPSPQVAEDIFADGTSKFKTA